MCATVRGAHAFHRDERGTIAPGLRILGISRVDAPVTQTARASSRRSSKESNLIANRPIDAVSGVLLKPGHECRIDELRPGLADYLRRRYPSLRPDDYIDKSSIEELRRQSILDLLREDRGELTSIENEVAESIASRETLTENPETEFDDRESLGSRSRGRFRRQLAVYHWFWQLPCALDDIQHAGRSS